MRDPAPSTKAALIWIGTLLVAAMILVLVITGAIE